MKRKSTVSEKLLLGHCVFFMFFRFSLTFDIFYIFTYN